MTNNGFQRMADGKTSFFMLKSSTIIGGPGNNKRRDLDYYPTPKNCTVALMNFLNLSSSLKIWEPACGTGDISKVLIEHGHTVISTDLRHTGYGQGGIDYLTTPQQEHDAIVTNPPFNLSAQFIKKALQDAPLVAMLLKSQYWHAKKRYELFKKHRPAYVLPLTWRPDFTKGGIGSPTMDIAWTVWCPNKNICEYIPLLKPCI